MATTIKLRGPVDLEELHQVCSGVTATIEVAADGGELVLSLAGDEAEGCAELLAGWLQAAGVELMQAVA